MELSESDEEFFPTTRSKRRYETESDDNIDGFITDDDESSQVELSDICIQYSDDVYIFGTNKRRQKKDLDSMMEEEVKSDFFPWPVDDLVNMEFGIVKAKVSDFKGNKELYDMKTFNYQHQYPNWNHYLSCFFPLLIYGVGCKKSVANDFFMKIPGTSRTKKYIVDGFQSGEIKILTNYLAAKSTKLKLDMQELFSKKEDDIESIYVLIHDIDQWKSLESLKTLESSNIHLIIVMDHIHTQLRYDFRRWIKINVTTYQPYNLTMGETRDQPLDGIKNIFISLNEKEKLIFQILLSMKESNITISDLKTLCEQKEVAIVVEKSHIKKWIKVLVDHHLIKLKNDLITVPFTDKKKILDMIV